MSFKAGDFKCAQSEHLAFGIREVEAAFIDPDAKRDERQLELRLERLRHAGLDEAAEWYESALAAVRGARKELGGE